MLFLLLILSSVAMQVTVVTWDPGCKPPSVCGQSVLWILALLFAHDMWRTEADHGDLDVSPGHGLVLEDTSGPVIWRQSAACGFWVLLCRQQYVFSVFVRASVPLS